MKLDTLEGKGEVEGKDEVKGKGEVKAMSYPPVNTVLDLSQGNISQASLGRALHLLNSSGLKSSARYGEHKGLAEPGRAQVRGRQGAKALECIHRCKGVGIRLACAVTACWI